MAELPVNLNQRFSGKLEIKPAADGVISPEPECVCVCSKYKVESFITFCQNPRDGRRSSSTPVIHRIIAQEFRTFFRFMDPQLIPVCAVPLQRSLNNSLEDWLNPSILWNTPRRRRCLEDRQARRFGSLEWGTYKLPKHNKKIRVDHKTGEYFELGKLAPLTYKRIMEETKLIQERMKDAFGTGTPKDQDVVVLYKGEEREVPDKFRVVEMEHERPSFFSQNLLQKNRNPETSSQTVKPSGLV